MDLQVDVKVMLRDHEGKPFMGIGVLWLLEGIHQHRSINSAAREMNLSYPKALRMIKNLERALGLQVVVRHRGGNARGGAELTQQGREFLCRYDRLQERIRKFAADSFERDFASTISSAPSR